MIALWMVPYFVAAVILGFVVAPTLATDRNRRNRPVIRDPYAGRTSPPPPVGPGSSVPPKRWSE